MYSLHLNGFIRKSLPQEQQTSQKKVAIVLCDIGNSKLIREVKILKEEHAEPIKRSLTVLQAALECIHQTAERHQFLSFSIQQLELQLWLDAPLLAYKETDSSTDIQTLGFDDYDTLCIDISPFLKQIPDDQFSNLTATYFISILYCLFLRVKLDSRKRIKDVFESFDLNVCEFTLDNILSTLHHFPELDIDNNLKIFIEEYQCIFKAWRLIDPNSPKEIFLRKGFNHFSIRRGLLKAINCFLRHMIIHIPYNRIEFRKAMKLLDTKERRYQCFNIIKSFDRRIESSNIRNVTDLLNYLSRFSENPIKLVVGRESRAFGNQAYLLANAKYVYPSDALRSYVKSLLKLSDPDVVIEKIRSSVENADDYYKSEIENLIKDIKLQNLHILSSLGKIKFLINLKTSPLTQYYGSIQSFKETLEIYYKKSFDSLDKIIANTENLREEFIDSYEIDFSKYSATIRSLLNRYFEEIHLKLDEIFKELNSLKHKDAAFSILLQRPSLTGSERFKSNELESKPEQEDALQKLVHIGGNNLHMSPSYEWICHATDIIEAVPLFIYERTIVKDNKPVTIFDVDQEGLEQTIRTIADYWAENIDNVIMSEHMSLAREILVKSNNEFYEKYQELIDSFDQDEDIVCLSILANEANNGNKNIIPAIIKLYLWLTKQYRMHSYSIEKMVENEWKLQNSITRLDALRKHIPNNLDECLKLSDEIVIDDTLLTSIQPKVFERRRQMPGFHLLTTEAPGLVEGFFSIVLEEEMAMRNIIKDYNLEEEVNGLSKSMKERLLFIGKIIIEEYDYMPLVTNYVQSGYTEENAMMTVMSENEFLEEEVSILSVLLEVCNIILGKNTDEVSTKDELYSIEDKLFEQLISIKQFKEIDRKSIEEVWNRNESYMEFKDFFSTWCSNNHFTSTDFTIDEKKQIIETSPIYTKEAFSIRKDYLRRKAIKLLDKKYNLYLQERIKSYFRSRTALLKTTARRKCICRHNLLKHLTDPLYLYSSGLQFEFDGSIKPVGSCKRYHLIYGPSRVNLGKDERKSVETWPQFVGVSDPLAAEHAYNFYALINYNPVIRNIKEAENLKVSENQWTALIRSVRNVQALFVERVGMGDIEDLAYQFNMRGGLAFGYMKEKEGYNAGPTAGYCIPKDLLFKLFVANQKDDRKLAQIGIPQHVHKILIDILSEISKHRSDFETSVEWERWASSKFLEIDNLLLNIEDKHLIDYIKETEASYIFHPTRITNVLSYSGVPSPYMNADIDFNSVLWSNWADHKITLGGEQVNRSLVFTMTRSIFLCAEKARKLNPNANISPNDKLFIQLHGVYKGDDNEPPPPDVRYSWTMRAFQILSGQYQSVMESLDEEGQIIARLCCVGFQPFSSNAKDIECSKYIARKFLGLEEFPLENNELLVKFKKSFPPCYSVGDITITVVPGVDSEDLLGYSAETLTLLGECADYAKAELEKYGMTESQMKANAILRRQFPYEWSPLNNLPDETLEKIKEKIGGSIHPLILRLRGPGTDFMEDIQGKDVCVFSITHSDILVIDPSHLRDLMLIGRPNSALIALDFVSQGRHICWFDRDIMLWYAAGRRINSNGRMDLDWSNSHKNRQSIYKSLGEGTNTYKPLLGTDLRDEVIRQENRASQLFYALKNIDTLEDSSSLNSLIDEWILIFKKYINKNSMNKECQLSFEYTQRLLLANRLRNRDKIIQDALSELASGIEHYEFNEIHWLAIGGIYLINGTPVKYQHNILNTIHRARKKINKFLRKRIYKDLDYEKINCMIVPCFTKEQVSLSEKKTEMFSVKASETSKTRSITRRAELALQSILSVVKVSFVGGYESYDRNEHPSLSYVHSILKTLSSESISLKESYFQFGKLLRLAEESLINFTTKFIQNEQLQSNIIKQAKNLANLQDIKLNISVFDEFCGTYENHGLISEMFSLFKVEEERFDCIMDLCEILYICLAVDRTIPFISNNESYIRNQNIWRNLCEFFAKTINDHYYEYNPWFLDPKRCSSFLFLFKDIGSVKEEYTEWLYKKSWQHHRILYQYIRSVIIRCTDAKYLDDETIKPILGEVSIDNYGDISKDNVTYIAIGNECIEEVYEQLWRAYNQLREVSFMRNDGFSFPYVFTQFDPEDPLILNSKKKVNMVILSPVGRTHYSRMIMESSRINDNIIITRSGSIGKYKKEGDSIVDIFTIRDGHFWISEKQFEMALKQFKNLNSQEASKIISKCKTNGQLTPKGIRIAAKFIKDLIVGVSICFHHHPYEHTISKLLYPSTDKSPFLFDLTYNKSIYPFIYTQESNVLLPPEVDWFQSQTRFYMEKYSNDEEKVIKTIQKWLLPFIEENPIIIVKGASESGARNLQRFDLKLNNQDKTDINVLNNCSRFIFQISKSQNVTIQKAIISSPLMWMSKYAIDSFIEREIDENEIGVNIQTHPKDYIYGSLRIIMSCSVPPLDNLHDCENWEASHKIYLTSTQIATNVGRQGILDILSPDMIRSEWRDTFIKDLEEVGSFVMSATSNFGPIYWNDGLKPNKYEHILPFKERFPDIPEKDVVGVPTWWPRYLMIDIIPEPILINKKGRRIEKYSIIEEDYEGGQYIVMDERKVIHRCKVIGFKYYLLEPNVGIGLWPNYWKREVVKEKFRENYYKNEFSWDAVGLSDIKVLSNFIEAGRQFVKAKLNKDVEKAKIIKSFEEKEDHIASRALKSINDQYGLYIFNGYNISLYIIEFMSLYIRPMVENNLYESYDVTYKLFNKMDKSILKLDEIPSRVSASTVYQWLNNNSYMDRICQLITERLLYQSLAPPVQLSHDKLKDDFISKLCPHKATLAIAFDQLTLISHQIHPFILGSYESKCNIIGISTDWIIKNTSLVKRAIFYDHLSHTFIEGDLYNPISFDFIYFVQLSGKEEVSKHQYWCKQMEGIPVYVINDAKIGSIVADNKLWIRENLAKTEYPNYMIINRENLDDLSLINSFVSQYDAGVILQPSSNTTESKDVYYFKSNETEKLIDRVKSLIDSYQTLLLSEFRGNICYNGKSIVLRLNVIMGNVTASIFVGNNEEKIVSLKKGSCPRLYHVLSNLQDVSSGKIIKFNVNHWMNILQFASNVYECCNLPIIGIDTVLEYDNTSNEINPVLLEVNCRPGSVIFGERPIFTEGILSESIMESPIDGKFWNYLNNSKIDISRSLLKASNLYEWKLLLTTYDYYHPSFKKIFARYIREGDHILKERIFEFQKIINNAIRKGFSATKPFIIVASNGRDRYFCGHTDFDGLGGITINATNNKEILGIFQENDDETIELTNSNPLYESHTISIKEIYDHILSNDGFRKIYDPQIWHSYIKAALTYSLSSNFEFSGIVCNCMYDKSIERWKGMKVHFQSNGLLKLESENGNSSSSALTTCFILGLVRNYNMPISTTSLGMIDYCEYYLGKTAGAADATTILTSSPGDISVISSFPDVRLSSFKLSPMINVMIINTRIPRLNSSKGKIWLANKGYNDEQIDKIYEWAKSIMNRFGSKVYVEGVKHLIEALKDKEKVNKANISDNEVDIVLKCLKNETNGQYYLRELCLNGRVEQLNPIYKGWDKRYKRYNLIFRLLKLIPETAIIQNHEYSLRKAVLFGLAEVERGWYYVKKMSSLKDKNDCIEIINLIKWSHDGDRATVDYRNDFDLTPWSTDKRNNVSDVIIDQWISNESEELIDKPGGFERSLPEIDEWADELIKDFDGKAALRISAAGLGGCLCVHSMNNIAKDVEKWFLRRGCDVRKINPGSCAQVLYPN